MCMRSERGGLKPKEKCESDTKRTAQKEGKREKSKSTKVYPAMVFMR